LIGFPFSSSNFCRKCFIWVPFFLKNYAILIPVEKISYFTLFIRNHFTGRNCMIYVVYFSWATIFFFFFIYSYFDSLSGWIWEQWWCEWHEYNWRISDFLKLWMRIKARMLKIYWTKLWRNDWRRIIGSRTRWNGDYPTLCYIDSRMARNVIKLSHIALNISICFFGFRSLIWINKKFKILKNTDFYMRRGNSSW
jgi:hypothetical protein